MSKIQSNCDTCSNYVYDDELEYYTEDDTFAELMDTFLCLMSNAKKNGGLYVDGIVSK